MSLFFINFNMHSLFGFRQLSVSFAKHSSVSRSGVRLLLEALKWNVIYPALLLLHGCLHTNMFNEWPVPENRQRIKQIKGACKTGNESSTGFPQFVQKLLLGSNSYPQFVQYFSFIFSYPFLILFISALKAYILCRQQQCRYEAALPLFLYIIYSPVYPCILSNHRSLIQYGLLIGQN